MTNAHFVTATGTEIGKTYICAALLRAAREKGKSVSALKPLMSGYDSTDLNACDAGQLLIACGREATQQSVDEICLHRFTEPLAPNVAARRAGLAINDDALVGFCRKGLAHTAADGLMLIEGAGGVLSPVSDTMLHGELITALALPAILVTTNYLGSVTHTLTAIEALERRAATISLVVVSQPTPDSPPPSPLIEELALFRPTLKVITAPFTNNPSHIGASLHAALENDEAQ